MTKKQKESIALFLKAMERYFNSEEKHHDPQERTPIHTVTPDMFISVRKLSGVDDEAAYLLAAFALATVKGMYDNPSEVPIMCGGKDTGGNLIVALEALRVSMSDNDKKE